jgi:protein O-mannosyl-transferase
MKQKDYLNLGAVSGIVLLGVLIYSNSFDCSFHFDDMTNIVNNSKLHKLSDIRAWWNFYPTRPVGIFTLALNYYFSKEETWSYHLVNLTIHLINALLVWWLTRIILSTPSMKASTVGRNKDLISLLAALLFVSHPLATQAVTYIVQRMASLVAMFYLLSLAMYVRGRSLRKGDRKKYLLFAGSFLAAVLAMLTKENAFTLPFAILLFEICFLQKHWPKINFRDWKVILGGVVFLGIIAIIPFKMTTSAFNNIPPSLGHTYSLTPYNYLLTQFSVVVTYVRLLFIPVNQAVDYDYHIAQSFFEFRTLADFLFLLLLFAAAVFLFKKQRILAFCIFWFFLTLSVESGFIPISDVIFEHRTYLPSVGFVIAITSALFILLKGKNKWVAVSILLLVIAINSILTYERNKVWKNDLTLWSDNVKKFPGIARPLSNLGKAKSVAGDLAGGMADYNQAIILNPQYSMVYFNRGVTRYLLKDYAGALSDYNFAIKYDTSNSSIFVNRGNARAAINDNKGALEDYEKALTFDPLNADIYFNCAISAQNLGDYNRAVSYLETAIRIRPEFPQAFFRMGIIKSLSNDQDAAIRNISTALRLDPGMMEAYKNRGQILFRQGKYGEALNDLNKALEIKPDAPEIWVMKAETCFQMKNLNDALSAYSRALELNPRLYDAWMEKALLEFTMKDYDLAIRDFSAAIAVNPQSGNAYCDRGINKFNIKDTKGACLDWKKAAELGNHEAIQYLQIYCK